MSSVTVLWKTQNKCIMNSHQITRWTFPSPPSEQSSIHWKSAYFVFTADILGNTSSVIGIYCDTGKIRSPPSRIEKRINSKDNFKEFYCNFFFSVVEDLSFWRNSKLWLDHKKKYFRGGNPFLKIWVYMEEVREKIGIFQTKL